MAKNRNLSLVNICLPFRFFVTSQYEKTFEHKDIGVLRHNCRWHLRPIAITAGVAILMFVADTLVGAWADKKDKQYFGTKETDQDGETH